MNKLLNREALNLIDSWHVGQGQRQSRKRHPMLADFVEHLEDNMPDWWLAHFFQREDSERLLEQTLEKVILYNLRHAS